MKSFIKFIVFSNLFVAICVVAFTHSTYIVHNLPSKNLAIVLTMVFCFTFFTYNIQRFIKFKKKLSNSNIIGNRLKWIAAQKNNLTILSVIAGIIGLGCTYYIHLKSFIILIPMGILSFFYVIPIIPFYKKSPTLREIPYLKIFVIAFVWSLIIVLLPLIDSNSGSTFNWNEILLALLQNFCFVIAITLPFDIRDIDYDNSSKLKTIPRYLGVTKTIILAEFLLIGAIVFLYNSNVAAKHFYGLLIGYIITMIVIAFSKKERSELFFAGLIEGLILVLYGCVLISEYCFSL